VRQCERCADLHQDQDIRTPGQLAQALRVVRDNLADGTIVQTSAESAAVLKPERPWPDVIERQYRCTRCKQRFALAAETYHGAAGSWRLA
jgi:hypothetical protein